jgi:hypothetical protein
MKKTEGRKSRATVPLSDSHYFYSRPSADFLLCNTLLRSNNIEIIPCILHSREQLYLKSTQLQFICTVLIPKSEFHVGIEIQIPN